MFSCNFLDKFLVFNKQNKPFNKLVVIFTFCLLLSLTGCFKSNKAPVPQSQADSTSNSSLDTTDNNEVNKWLIPMISEYLSNDASISTCGDNNQTITGSVTIVTQADVDQLATVNKIVGDLIINPSSNLDFSSLDLLTEITGNFELSASANQTILTGFDCLSTVGGNFGIGVDFNNPNTTLTLVSGFSSLKSVNGYFVISHNHALLNIIGFSSLESTGNFGYSFNSELQTVTAFSKLKSAGNITIENNSNLMSFTEFSALETITKLYLVANTQLLRIPAFPTLKSVLLQFEIESNAYLEEIAGFPTLESVGTEFSISNNTRLANIANFPVLSSVGADFTISNNSSLTDISSFSALISIASNFYLSNPVLTNLTAFSNLRGVGGQFELSGNNALEDIQNFPLLKSIGGDLIISNNANINRISGFNELNASDIVGNSTVNTNPKLDCTDPEPTFKPVTYSSGNDVDCP